MSNFQILHLNLQIANAAGQEQRVEQIARRAVGRLAERLNEQAEGGSAEDDASIERLSAEPVRLRLSALSDDQAAEALAAVLLAALAIKAEV